MFGGSVTGFGAAAHGVGGPSFASRAWDGNGWCRRRNFSWIQAHGAAAGRDSDRDCGAAGKGVPRQFVRQGRRKALTLSIVNAAAGLATAPGGEIALVRIALGAIAPTPIRARRAEAVLVGRKSCAGVAGGSGGRGGDGDLADQRYAGLSGVSAAFDGRIGAARPGAGAGAAAR